MVDEPYGTGSTVSLVARRHGVAPNQLFTWQRLAAQGALTAAVALALVDSGGPMKTVATAFGSELVQKRHSKHPRFTSRSVSRFSVARYFFDVDDGHWTHRDEEGQELPDLDAARREALQALPEVAYHVIPRHGDRQTLTVLVTDEDGHPVYTATLNFTGVWLLR